MAIDVKQYADELLKEAGADEATRQAFLNVISNEKVSKRLSNEVSMQSDYNRNMDALKKEKDQWLSWYNGVLADTKKNQEAVAQYEAKVKAFEQQYGALDNQPAVIQQVQTDFLKKDDVQKMLDQQGNQMLTILEWVGKKPVEHFKVTGEVLDIPAIKKLAVEKGLSLDQAYQELTAPLFAERAQKDIEVKLKAAEEKGARDFASTHHIPIDAKPREYHPIFDRKPEQEIPAGPNRERALAERFAENWNSAAGATSGGT